ncbi:hypothetical protein BUALT_Bualt15G0003900 [Buddleja alternifolia]|uniref:Transcriptional elongation regulator MINIYO n=1 Tax=Buddleja alternifolia TaxID=168488 RepID=A0AAV6WBI5_9LAMI|nr:hypothetical protein BUALT_Bualt15G0003900 [Buddleja alternifolia]
MKKENSSGGSINPKPKILGATSALQISENDAAAMVGGIVEKGFSDNQPNKPLGPSAAPRPTVLPFPVARHRSHGPLWAPRVANFNGVNKDEDFGEEEDFSGMDMAADVANPVQRKQKKGLDFSRWQEIVKKDGNSVAHEKEKEPHSTGLGIGRKVKGKTSDKVNRHIADPNDAKLCRTSHTDDAKEQFMTVDGNASKVFKEVKEDTEAASQMASVNDIHRFRHAKNENIVQPVQRLQAGLAKSGDSLESQIDAENRARLAKMSVDEIAEAQTELMAKLNPELINALRKRAQTKGKRQKFSSSDVVNGGEADIKNVTKLTTSSDNSISDEPVKEVAGDTRVNKDDKATPNLSPQNSGMWDAWSKRVERVRDMRFSLDGNILNNDFPLVSDTGKASSQSGYSAHNVSERDFLRTEGDPGAAGYTIKEAVALARSVIPGQRTLALHLIAAVLDRAICSICKNQVGSASNISDAEGSLDWEAIWAFALGPEPELALSLRMSIDDNHNSVVLACAKAIQSVLSYDMNEIIFDISEKTPSYSKDVCTAPVFRSKPDVNGGFLRGGFWKYNTKPSNILRFGEESVGDEDEGENTIQDDIFVAGQDIAAGLVRMGILPRICYLLEADPTAPLEECLISILIAIARHSPTCAAAIMDCGRLVRTVASRFASNEQTEINPCKIKSVTLLKVLARLEKKNCLTLMKNGIFRQVTWHLYRFPFSFDKWVKSGREACKLSSALLVEQLRLWKVVVNYGYSISEFSDLFPSLCIWLGVPTMEKLIENDVKNEFFAITTELYLLLDVLACRLPNLYSHTNERTEGGAQDQETLSWSHLGPIIDPALEWLEVKRSLKDSDLNSFLWVVSSVLNMLSSVLKAVIPEDTTSLPNGRLPWLPDFVPKIGVKIIKNEYFKLSGVIDANHLSENGSIVEYFSHLRLQESQELAISSTCCLQGLVQLVASVDKLIQHANLDHNALSSREDKILANGIFNSCMVEVRDLLTTLMILITNEWQYMQRVDMFGRGGPAPGVGVGWGASAGGYWSLKTLLAQQDARLLTCLLEIEISEFPSAKDALEAGETGRAMQRLNSVLAACLVVGPGNNSVIDKLLKVIFKVPALKYLDFVIRQFLGKGLKTFRWNYEEEEYELFANVLTTHFKNRWLSKKTKRKAKGQTDRNSHKKTKKENRSLETIHEDMDAPNTTDEESTSLRLEWAHQRLPLPAYWFLSAISGVHSEINSCPAGASYKNTYMEVPSNFLEIAKAGLFFLLGLEAIPTFLTSEFSSPVKSVSVVWKLHAISAVLLSGMGVLEDEKSRDVYETLQNVYGGIVDAKESTLKFESDIHENYSTFIETLVDQFAAESYGDVLFGRQVAVYLHRSVDASVRLATWNASSNAHALELLPPLDKCFTKAGGYLEPIEDDERILEAYVKSWGSGALDKAATRGSMAFALVLNHISLFIFGDVTGDMVSLRNKLAKSLMRDYSRKQQHEGMMVKLVCYKRPKMKGVSEEASSLAISEIEKRLQLLKDVCEGQVTAVQKLESQIRRELGLIGHQYKT